MSQENVEIVRAQYASWSALAEGGDVASHIHAFFPPDGEYLPVEEIDAIRGYAALIRYSERWLEAWAGFRDQVDEIIDAGQVVFAAVTVHGRGGESGISITQSMFHVFEMRDGKIVRLHEYLDRDQAREAAGLGE